MIRFQQLSLVFVLVTALTTSFRLANAARPTDTVLPNTTKGYLSIRDLDLLTKSFDATQFGKLMKDEKMKPFVEQLRKQMDEMVDDSGLTLSLTLDDIKGIRGGEIGFAVIQPKGDKEQHAIALLVDVTGHNDKAIQLLEKVVANQKKKGATAKRVKIGGVDVTELTLPKRKGQPHANKIYYTIHEDQLIASDKNAVLGDILSRFAGERDDSLVNYKPYHATMLRCHNAANDLQPHGRWFVEPFGLAEVGRAASFLPKDAEIDLLGALSNTGFRVIEGIGGYATLATGKHEILHHTFVYAPGEFKQAANMLDFPKTGDLLAQPWIFRHCASYLTFNWNIQKAFESAKYLVDEIAGEEIFEDVLISIKKDPNGPRIDIRKDIVAHVGGRATVMFHYRQPITPESERFMVAIDLTDPEIVRRTVDKAMEHDPAAKKRLFKGKVIWEIINEGDDELAAVQIDAGGVPGIGFDEDPEEAGDGDKKNLPNSAVTVTEGHLIIASHVDFIRDLLGEVAMEDRLSEAMDYQLVNNELNELGGGEDSFRTFGRLDEEMRSTYELMRKGQMAESKTLLGRLLNRLLAPEEEGVVRKQKIDAEKLPEYQVVRRYLGPSGMYAKTEDDGWFISGMFLSKDTK